MLLLLMFADVAVVTFVVVDIADVVVVDVC